MKTSISVLNMNFDLESSYYGIKKGKIAKENNYQFEVKIIFKGNYQRFIFNTSINDYNEDKKHMTKDDLIFSFYCFLSDSICGYESFEDYLSNFGVNDGYEYKIYLQCVEQYEKYKLIFDEINIYEFMNAFQDQYSDYC